MIRPRRRKYLSRFSLKDNFMTVLLLTAVFGIGLVLSAHAGLLAVLLYLLLWVLSYGMIYYGTCRYCAYYGEKCPVPMEGSCVHHIFEKKSGGFGYLQLFWATLAYGLRVSVPAAVVFTRPMPGWGILYFGVLALFWIIHLRFSGCPNCINVQCPLNPDYIT